MPDATTPNLSPAEKEAENVSAWASFLAANPPPRQAATWEEWAAYDSWLRAQFAPPYPEMEG